MSRETKIGLLSIVVIAVMIWGYMFLKGRNLLSKSKTFYTAYKDVTDLNISSPVLMNGFKIGTVTEITPDPENVRQMIVTYVVEGEYGIPKNAVAVLYPVGVMSGKAISIEYDKVCSRGDCAENHAKLQGRVKGLLDSMLGEEQVGKYTSELTTSAKNIIAGIGAEGEPGAINETVRQLEVIARNLAALSATTNRLMESNARNIDATLSNISSVSKSIAKNNGHIEKVIQNLDKLSGDLARSEVDQTFGKLNKTMDSAVLTIDELKTTLQTTTKSLAHLQGILNAVDKGDGTAAQLIHDPNLYKNLNATSRELSLLLQDLRLNPKRYAHFSVFGKKQKTYTLPEQDPAGQTEK